MPETERPAAACPDVKRALEEGEQRSREAANPSAPVWHVALWRRHKWKFFGLLLFLLTEFCLFTWGGTPR